MNRPLVILGAGGNAHDVLDIVEALNADAPSWNVIGFLDDRQHRGGSYLGRTVLGPLSSARAHGNCSYINSIRTEHTYINMPSIIQSTGLEIDQFATLIHPAAGVSPRAQLNHGVYVNFAVSIGGGVTVGNHVSLGPGCVIGHNVIIEDYATIAAGAVISGAVTLGRCCYIGAGAMIKQGLRIGDLSLVGMGAVVVRDVAAFSTVVGNPAHPLERAGATKIG